MRLDPNPSLDRALRVILPILLGVAVGLALPRRAEAPQPCSPRVVVARVLEAPDAR